MSQGSPAWSLSSISPRSSTNSVQSGQSINLGLSFSSSTAPNTSYSRSNSGNSSQGPSLLSSSRGTINDLSIQLQAGSTNLSFLGRRMDTYNILESAQKAGRSNSAPSRI